MRDLARPPCKAYRQASTCVDEPCKALAIAASLKALLNSDGLLSFIASRTVLGAQCTVLRTGPQHVPVERRVCSTWAAAYNKDSSFGSLSRTTQLSLDDVEYGGYVRGKSITKH